MLAVFVLGALVALYVLKIQSNVREGRSAFVAITAVGALYALGTERWVVPTWARFVLPVLGLVGTVIAIRNDVIAFYR